MPEQPEQPETDPMPHSPSHTPPTSSCPECGTPARQRGQSFCDSCGAFLRWDTPAGPVNAAAQDGPGAPGTPAPSRPRQADASDHSGPARPESAPSAPAAPESGKPATPGPASAPTPAAADTTVPLPATGPTESTAGPAPASGSAAGGSSSDGSASGGSARGDSAPGGSPSGGGTPPRGSSSGSGMSDTAIRSLLVPVPEASGAAPAETPGGVLPGRPEAARPRVRQPAVPAEPESGAPCRGCGTPNAARRHFCRSCATPLKASAAPTAEGPYAGQRPRLHRDRTRWIARAVGAAVVVGLVVGGIFGGPPAARAVQDHFAKRVPVHPTGSSASHSAAKQPAKLAFDGYSNTWWGTGYAGDSAGQWIQADFGQPTDLLNLLITPGTSPRTAQAAQQARPMEFDLVVSDSAGKEHTMHRRINDGGVQKIDVRVRDAVTARLILRSAYGAADNRQVAIAELEFFGRSAKQ
ncbi:MULTISPECIES: discoidin domain-containing protein [Streptomyces]|uniref:discoidin domain-containing protein n=1 Tax=Streptomyces TaxID=1883 RepID=UPI001E56CB66|nr:MULTISPECIES: discoidin domain-containing protein [Streptomyces]UFQ18626.1 discoidin domain-containing protein [Streptomyces huasconensis]WCL88241.1 discoidin domain-containing protein [Streptomyces sp. JCM 35825]